MDYRIPLHGKDGSGKFTVVDDADHERVSGFGWRGHRYDVNGPVYVVTDMKFNGQWRTVRLHRFILNAPDGMDVDHINGDTLDNRRSNLRLATRAENTRNRKQNQNSSTKYKGVSRQKGRWSATVSVNGERRYLGAFATQYEAASAYNEAAIRLHGEFARLNELPDKPESDDTARPLLRPANGPKRSQYRNVVWDNERQCWIARLTVNGKPKFLGRFADENEAAKAVEVFVSSR